MAKASYARKRKVPNDKEKKAIAKKDAKHLLDFGEAHPLDDQKIKLEDKLAKRVYDDEDDNLDESGEKETNDQAESDLDEDQDNFYGQLLDVFGKKQKVAADSDEDDGQLELIDNKESTRKVTDDRFERFNVESNEDVESEEEEEGEEDKNCTESTIDNFSTHFFANFDSNDIELLSKAEKVSTPLSWPHLGSLVECRPKDDKFDLVKIGKPFRSIDQLQLKQLLCENIGKTMLDVTYNRNNTFTPFQTELVGLLSSYKDLYYSERNSINSEQIRVAYCIHALNHILKTRSRILSHNSKISQNHMQKDEYRDQGLTRPKVLIVLPFRDAAYRAVNCMINLLFADAKDTGEKKINIMNYKRFKTEFGPPEEETSFGARKPEDYKQLFTGNNDDSFRVGISLTKKSLKLYSEFYSSDIIIASPLGLRLILGAEGDEEREYDFLSSIDIVMFDQTEVLLMQNWEHVLHLMDHLHMRPKKDHNIDYSRVKLWVLEMWSRFFCQLIVFSSNSNSMISGLFNKYSRNFSGKVITRNEITTSKAAINHVFLQIPQTFQRFRCDSFANNSDDRFNFFIQKLLPRFKDKFMVRTMIYIPSYFDFVRLRNYLRKEDIGFGQVCEYTKEGKVAKARHIFFYGGRQFLLFTERFHFFNRYTIKGIRHVIFYEPPTFPNFYSEIINSMHLSNQGKKLTTDYSSMSVTVLFNKFDAHSLVALTGTKTATTLLQSDSDVHLFVTNNALT